MERSIRDMLGGGLRPSDPRRFMIEAMVSAMSADGMIDARETAMMQRQITSHHLLEGLTAAAARTLVEISTDAIKYAGSAIERAPAIAKGLPARIHRLAAYGMAAEVIAADHQIAISELVFLEALRMSMRISPIESESIIQAARVGKLAEYLDDQYLRLKSLISIAAEIFALRARTRGTMNDHHKFSVREFFSAIPDLAASQDQLEALLYRAFRRPSGSEAHVYTELARIAQSLPDPVDRYWMVVYALVAESPSTIRSWRVIPFVALMQAAFQIVDADIELAVSDALTFSASLPRPS